VFINPATKEVEFTPCQRRCATQDWVKQYALRKLYPITAQAFDVMELYGLDVTKQPYLKRKQLLFELLDVENWLEVPLPTIQYTPFTLELEKAWEDVLRRGSEGLVLKDVYAGYEYERSYKWLKLKNWKHIIVSVVGYTLGENARSPFFGSLVLTDPETGEFKGCVGSGFSDWDLRQIKDILSDAERVTPPFDIGEEYVALKLELRVKVKFYKATMDGLLRFPVFVGIVGQSNTHTV